MPKVSFETEEIQIEVLKTEIKLSLMGEGLGERD